jgi:hypothetical protein
MTHERIKTAAVHLRSQRKQEASAEKVLAYQVSEFCNKNPGNMVGLAATLEISTAYMSDIRHGKRKLSDALVNKMARLSA